MMTYKRFGTKILMASLITILPLSSGCGSDSSASDTQDHEAVIEVASSFGKAYFSGDMEAASAFVLPDDRTAFEVHRSISEQVGGGDLAATVRQLSADVVSSSSKEATIVFKGQACGGTKLVDGEVVERPDDECFEFPNADDGVVMEFRFVNDGGKWWAKSPAVGDVSFEG